MAYFVRLNILAYMVFMILTINQCMSLNRKVLLTTRLFGPVSANGVKYNVTFREETIMPSFAIDNPIDFLFLSHSEHCECLLTALLKLAVGVLLQVILWNYDEDSLFKRKYIRRILTLFLLLGAVLLTTFIENLVTGNWVDTYKGLNGYQYKGQDGYTLYSMLFILALISGAYLKAIKNQREVDLTI